MNSQMGQPGVDTSEVSPAAALVLGAEASAASFEAVGAGEAGVSDILGGLLAALLRLLGRHTQKGSSRTTVDLFT